jgi:hypothetical protein
MGWLAYVYSRGLYHSLNINSTNFFNFGAHGIREVDGLLFRSWGWILFRIKRYFSEICYSFEHLKHPNDINRLHNKKAPYKIILEKKIERFAVVIKQYCNHLTDKYEN